MLTWFEERRRLGKCVYKVVTLYVVGIPVLRRWQQLTVTRTVATPEEIS